MFYRVYHDIGPVSDEYWCYEVEYANDTVILRNVWSTVAFLDDVVYLHTSRGNVRVREMAKAAA